MDKKRDQKVNTTIQSDIISLVREETGFTNHQIKTIVKSYINQVIEAVLDGERVKIDNLGSFWLREVPEREYNFLGKEKFMSPAHYQVRFKVSPTFKQLAREK